MKFRFIDKERDLRYSLGDILKIQKDFSEGFKVQDIAELVRMGLAHDEPTLTAEAVAEIIEVERFEELMEAIAQATGMKKPVRPTGATAISGPSHDSTSDSGRKSSARSRRASSGS